MIRPLLSGEKRNYYGKGETVAYRLDRSPDAVTPLLGVRVTLIIWGEAFWRTYTHGDNTGLIATDSMKNFVQRETLNFTGDSVAGLALFLGKKFLDIYPQAEGAELHAEEVPYDTLGGAGFAPGSGAHRTARVWLGRDEAGVTVRDLRVGLAGYELLRLSGSAFHGFVRDQYTTLPDLRDRPLRMKLAVEWTQTEPDADPSRHVHRLLIETFENFASGSIQEVLYQMGSRVLADVTEVERLDLEGQNHTWDAVTDPEASAGVFTVAKPFYGILGLSLTRADLAAPHAEP